MIYFGLSTLKINRYSYFNLITSIVLYINHIF